MSLLNWFHDYFNPPADRFISVERHPDGDPLPPSNLSCFARGVIRSIETNTSGWCEHWTYEGRGVAHRDSGLTVITRPILPEGIGHIHAGSVLGYRLTPEERDAIYAAALKHVIAPEEQRRNIRIQQNEAKVAAASAARKAVFERLGCP